ncbi:hypothetical protein ACS0TY_006805 [Phlomoides rotata]
MKEPEIKLFGRKILLTDNGGEVSVEETSDQTDGGSGGGAVDGEEREKADDEKHLPDEEDENPDISSEVDENPEEEAENEERNARNGEQKQLKKPDIILPCPRCNSMDTKFCYYNNYNVNQPRHFCKSCQRYWTAGGTMRNVPVGAGRRKNKNSASHCHHITISEALQASLQVDPPNSAFKPPNGTVLSFGSDSLSCKKGETMDDNSVGSSSIVTSSLVQKRDENCHNLNGAPYPVPCIPGVAWPFTWTSAVPVPAICPPGYPMPFYPNPYWNCGVPSAWNVVPWGSGKGSPLGKHSRNGELIRANGSEGREDTEPKNLECSIVVPKTMRIDDLEEKAKSSIWEALGIKHDRVSRGLFKALQPKSEEKKGMVSAGSSVLQANPAALSRSINFQETA